MLNFNNKNYRSFKTKMQIILSTRTKSYTPYLHKNIQIIIFLIKVLDQELLANPYTDTFRSCEDILRYTNVHVLIDKASHIHPPQTAIWAFIQVMYLVENVWTDNEGQGITFLVGRIKWNKLTFQWYSLAWVLWVYPSKRGRGLMSWRGRGIRV